MNELKKVPTTITQRLRFIELLRESHDNNQREVITTLYTPEQVSELLKDINEDLIFVQRVQLKPVVLCPCGRPISSPNINAAANFCSECLQKQFDNMLDQTAGIP